MTKKSKMVDNFALRYVRIYPGVNSRAELATLAPGIAPLVREKLTLSRCKTFCCMIVLRIYLCVPYRLSLGPFLEYVNHAVNIFPEFIRWTICARVTSKSDIREWSNSHGEGRVFDVDLIDESVSTLCPLVYSGCWLNSGYCVCL